MKNSYQYDEEYDEVIIDEEDEEPMPQTMDEWMRYNGLSWSDFIQKGEYTNGNKNAQIPNYK